MIAGIETGGTKVICATAHEDSPDKLINVLRMTTTTPSETIGRINDYLIEASAIGELTGIGVASFGPLNVDPASDRYGWITSTTKPGWQDTNLLEMILPSLTVPTELVTDVSGAALGEFRWGVGRGHNSMAYMTFGTGVGAGLIVNAELIAGDGYPEIAHIMVRRHPSDSFVGVCPFHGDCLEGLASGPAVLARWGADASSLPVDVTRVAHEIIAFYIAQLASLLGYTLGIEKIVLGGGVSKAPGLIELVGWQLREITGGEHFLSGSTQAAFDYVVAPELADYSGVHGALSIAQRAAQTGLPTNTRKIAR
ncbi:MAG: ROK family protein [Lacisediminihabitans sp.]